MIAAAETPAAIYRRQARRLRARFSAQPRLLQAALVDLARRHDGDVAGSSTSQVSKLPASPRLDGTGSAVEQAFASHVASHLRGQILRYSDRLKLLKAADRLRIGRFRANLIIAMAQHETKAQTTQTATDALWWKLRRPRSMASLTGLILLGELAAVAIWWFEILK